MKLAIIGTGYVGLVTGACFAEMGNEVICVDADVVQGGGPGAGTHPHLRAGAGGLRQAQSSRTHRLSFTTDLAAGGAGEPGLLHRGGHPPGQGRLRRPVHGPAGGPGHRPPHERLQGHRGKIHRAGGHGRCRCARSSRQELAARGEVFEFDVVSNPEFLKEGTAIDDFMKPDRIVVGCDDVRVAELMKELYGPFVRTNAPIIIMDVVSAELTKYAANAFLATKISFINEIANICSRTGANINMVRRGIGSDRRIGPLFLFPGLGYGGSCFPKDMQALIHTAHSLDYTPRLLEAAEAVNQDQRRLFFEVIIANYYRATSRGGSLPSGGCPSSPRPMTSGRPRP